MKKNNESLESIEESPKSKIEVNDPLDLRPTELPLIVKLPEGASKAQQEFAKVLNAYAYQNPQKWAVKKDELIKKLESLENAPDPIEGNLKIRRNSGV